MLFKRSKNSIDNNYKSGNINSNNINSNNKINIDNSINIMKNNNINNFKFKLKNQYTISNIILLTLITLNIFLIIIKDNYINVPMFLCVIVNFYLFFIQSILVNKYNIKLSINLHLKIILSLLINLFTLYILLKSNLTIPNLSFINVKFIISFVSSIFSFNLLIILD